MKAPIISDIKQQNPRIEFLHLPGKKGWDFIVLGFVVFIALALFLYGSLMWGGSRVKIRYSPADILYGEKIHAVHEMGPRNNSRDTGYTLASSAGKPEIRLSENFYDFGEVNSQKVLTRTFVIANSGKAPLILQRAYTTCACTMADFTATEIPAGKVILMTLQFDPGYHDLRGKTVRRGVIFETNDPDHPTQEIWVQASVR